MRNIIFLNYGAFSDYLFKDLIDRNDTFVYYIRKPEKNKGLQLLKKIHLSKKINSRMNLPGHQLWFRKDEIDEHLDQDTRFIFTTESLGWAPADFVPYLQKEYPENSFILLALDSVEAHSYCMQYARPLMFHLKWDLILSYDVNDCRKYGFQELGYSYYSRTADLSGYKPTHDLQYIGLRKASGNYRERKMLEIFEKCRKNGVSCDFTVVQKKGEEYPDGIHVYPNMLPYEKVLEHIGAAGCILEILQEGQNQQSARYFEAVVYNKKLLTTNDRISALPFYNPDYMKVFHTSSDVDIDWLKARDMVDYGYKGEFSPSGIPALIDKYL